MNRLLISLMLSVALSVSAVPAMPFDKIIGDDVELFFTIRNLSEMHEKWASHPIAESLESGLLSDWFEHTKNSKDDSTGSSPGFEKALEDTYNLSVDELFQLFSGQINLSIYNLSDLILQKDKHPKLVLMAEFSGDTEQLDELMQIQFERNAEKQKKANSLIEHEIIEESFMGETLYFDEIFDGEKTYIEDGYALVDNILVIATPENRLREAVELIKEGTLTSISESDAYQRYREQTNTGNTSLYINLAELMSPLNAALMELPILKSLAIFGVTPQSLETALSLESFQALYTDIELVEDGFLLQYGILFSEKRGLLSLVNYADSTLPEAPYVPEGVLSSSVSLFDINAMLTNLEKILGLASPALPQLIDIQIQTAETNVGVDIRTFILENFGNQIVNFSVLNKNTPEGVDLLQPQQIFAVDLKDAEGFKNALNALKDISPAKSLIEEQIYDGETIYSLKKQNAPNDSETQFNYVITRSKLIVNVGHISLLHEVLSNMASDKEGFWQDSSTKNLFERIERPNAVFRSFLDLEQFIDPFVKLIAEKKSGNLPKSIQSGEALKELEGPYRLISELNEEPGSFFGRTLAIKIREN